MEADMTRIDFRQGRLISVKLHRLLVGIPLDTDSNKQPGFRPKTIPVKRQQALYDASSKTGLPNSPNSPTPHQPTNKHIMINEKIPPDGQEDYFGLCQRALVARTELRRVKLFK